MAILLIIAVSSVAASQRGLPVSRAIICVSSALLLSSNEANFSTMAWRAPKGCLAQPAKAARAARHACATWAASASLPCHSTSPLTGLVFTRRSPSPVTQSPFIHNVMLFSPLHKDAQNVHGRPRDISGRQVAPPSVPDAEYPGRHEPT